MTVTGNGTHPVQRNNTTAIALPAVFAAVAVGGNYALAGVPNVEVSSVMVFLSGFLFGLTTGALTGLISMTIYQVWNPWGPSIPPIGVAVIGCTVLIGVVGGITGKNVQYTETTESKWFLGSGIIGVVLTLFYDLVTTFASGIAWAVSSSVLLLGLIPFTLVHVICNGILFGLLTPRISKLVGHHLRTHNLI